MKGIENRKLISALEKLPPEFLIMENDIKTILEEIGDNYYWSRENLEFIKVER